MRVRVVRNHSHCKESYELSLIGYTFTSDADDETAMVDGVKNLCVKVDKETQLYPSGSNTPQGQLSVMRK